MDATWRRGFRGRVTGSPTAHCRACPCWSVTSSVRSPFELMQKRPSPLTNRVTPFGSIVAHPARYPETSVTFGNRGCLHDSAYRVRKEFASTAWLSCKLRVDRTRKVQRDDNRVMRKI